MVTVAVAKKMTARREWFEELACNVAWPVGAAVAMNKACGHFGRVGHNNVLSGELLFGLAVEMSPMPHSPLQGTAANLHTCRHPR